MGYRHLIFALVSGLLFACSNCGPQPTPVDPAPPPMADGGSAQDAGQTSCERACGRLVELGCPEGNGTPKSSCVDVCENLEASEVARFCPDQVASIGACSELNAAFASCE